MKQPKGLRLFDRDGDQTQEADFTLVRGSDFSADNQMYACFELVLLDADQLDKLAERCKQFAAYLRSLPKASTKKPKWEDL